MAHDVIGKISDIPEVIEASAIDGGMTVKLDGGTERQADLVETLISMGVRVYSVRKEDPLEEAFMDITGGERD